MATDIKRAIKLLEEIDQTQSYIQRTDLFSIFIDQVGMSEGKFCTLILLLKAKKVFGEYHRGNGYYIDWEQYKKFKKTQKEKGVI